MGSILSGVGVLGGRLNIAEPTFGSRDDEALDDGGVPVGDGGLARVIGLYPGG